MAQAAQVTGAGTHEQRRLLAAEAPLLAGLALAPLAAGGMGQPLPALLLCALFWVSLLLRLWLAPRHELPVLRWGLPVLCLPLLAVVTLLTSANRGATILQALQLCGGAAVLWLSADTVRRGGAGRLLGAILAGAFLAAGLGLREYLLHLRQEGNDGWRTFGQFTNPNFYAGYLVPCLLIAAGAASRPNENFKRSTWLLVLALLGGAFGGALAATGSRGGMLSLAIGTVGYLAAVLIRRELRSTHWPVVAGLGASALMVGLIFSAPLRAREAGAAGPPLPSEVCPANTANAAGLSSRFRILTWQGVLKMGLKRPVLGWGAGTFDTTYAANATAGFTRHAHQNYLQLLAEMGVFGLLLWVGLLLAGFAGTWLLPRGEPWSWAVGAAGALLASSAHGLFDSLLFVPAIHILTAALLGMLMATGGEPDSELPPTTIPAESSPTAGARQARSRRDDRKARPAATAAVSPPLTDAQRTAAGIGVGFAIAGLLLTLQHAAGRALLEQARASDDPNAALGMLHSAERLLPWDHQVAVAETQAYRRLGDSRKALEQAQRAVRLAPLRPPGYFTLGKLHEAIGELEQAEKAYRAGLDAAPNEAVLLDALATLYGRQQRDREALVLQHRLAELEDSNIGQVRALAQVRDYRFARARMALAAEADGRQERAMAQEQRRRAACLLAERRRLHDVDPTAYFAVGDWEPELERTLRTEEEQLWKRLSENYGREGDRVRSTCCDDLTAELDRSRTRLEEIVGEVGSPSP
jgi:O-antigen ligase/tetratricopeptide (TPR) repeat protein